MTIRSTTADSISYLAKKLSDWEHADPSLHKLEEKLEESELKVSMEFGFASISINLSGTAQDLAKVVKQVRAIGYQTTSERPTAGSHEWRGLYISDVVRERKNAEGWYGLPQSERDSLELKWPDIHLNFSSTVCRRVQTGTKMVEEPVYEVRCGEEAAAADQSSDVEIPF